MCDATEVLRRALASARDNERDVRAEVRAHTRAQWPHTDAMRTRPPQLDMLRDCMRDILALERAIVVLREYV